MGGTQTQPFQLSFNAAFKVEFQGSRVTSDGGLILVRELNERLGFSDFIAQHFADPRGTNTQFPLADLVRQSIYSRLAGYENVTDYYWLPPAEGHLTRGLFGAILRRLAWGAAWACGVAAAARAAEADGTEPGGARCLRNRPRVRPFRALGFSRGAE